MWVSHLVAGFPSKVDGACFALSYLYTFFAILFFFLFFFGKSSLCYSCSRFPLPIIEPQNFFYNLMADWLLKRHEWKEFLTSCIYNGCYTAAFHLLRNSHINSTKKKIHILKFLFQRIRKFTYSAKKKKKRKKIHTLKYYIRIFLDVCHTQTSWYELRFFFW